MTRMILLLSMVKGELDIPDQAAWQKQIGHAVSGYGIFLDELDYWEASYGSTWLDSVGWPKI